MGWLANWLENKAEAARIRYKARVGEVLDALGRIPTGRALLDAAEAEKLFISFRKDVEGHATTINSRFIHIGPKAPEPLQPVYLAHELRHIWQDKEGLGLRRKTSVLDNLVNKRFQEADAFATEAQIAWELSAHNVEPEAWALYSRHHREFARAYEAAFDRDPDADLNGHAMRAVFKHWFSSSYKDGYDADSIEESRVQLERRACGRAATQEFERQRKDGAPERMSREFLREFGRVAGLCDYLDSVETKSVRYTGNISPANRRKIEKLGQTYPS